MDIQNISGPDIVQTNTISNNESGTKEVQNESSNNETSEQVSDTSKGNIVDNYA